MSDVSSTAPNQAPAKEPIFNPPSKWRNLWENLDILKLLALIVIVSYIVVAAIPGNEPDETHKNMALMAMAFYFGSSSDSRKKTDLMQHPATPPADKPV